METVNFQCGHCRQVLAVSKEHLGQQVRCPHCQQVVVAPLPSPPPEQPPAPVPLFPDTLEMPYRSAPEEYESIFSAPTESEDLFGGHPSGRVEMPQEVVIPPAAPPAEQTAAPPTVVPNLELQAAPPVTPGLPPADAALSFIPGGNTTLASTGEAPPIPETIAPFPQAPAPLPPTEAASTTGEEDLASVFRGGPVRTSRGGGWHIAVVIMPLISYSVLATIVAAIYFVRYRSAAVDRDQEQKEQYHPLEFLPDLQGDHPTGKKSKISILEVPLPDPNVSLPPQLRVALKETLRVGDLEVEPLRVERGRIKISDTPTGRAEESETEALKLYLRLKNVSGDLPFYPIDRYFTRRYDPLRDRPPYTQLIVGGQHFYGGAADWSAKVRRMHNEYVVGQEAYERQLQPGEDLTTFVCTDPNDTKLAKALEPGPGKKNIEWRIHLRRGAVTIKGRRIPAACVIGVEFAENEITNRANKGE